MAELNQNGNSQSKKIRGRKLTAKVDLTAMVDLAFLLITFFMLTTTLAKEKSMELYLPDDTGKPMPVDPNRTLTVLIGKDNKAECFMGEHSQQTKKIKLGTNELRRELTVRKKEVLTYSTAKGKPEQGLIVLIKPAKESNYGNLVEVLDEMAISAIPSYSIVD